MASWEMSISGQAGALWLERSAAVVAAGSKECRSRGAGVRNAVETSLTAAEDGVQLRETAETAETARDRPLGAPKVQLAAANGGQGSGASGTLVGWSTRLGSRV